MGAPLKVRFVSCTLFYYLKGYYAGQREQVTLETPVSVADYLEAHGFRAERVAIELNGEIIPRDKRADAMLDDQCVMEIVQFVQGG